MSDVPSPPGNLPEPESAHEGGGVWSRYRSLPVWLQILAPLVLIAAIVGGVVWASGGSDGDGDVASSETSTTSGDDALDVVLKGLIVAGALTDSSTPTTEASSSTVESTSTSTTITTTQPPPTTTTAPAASVTTTSTATSTTTTAPTTTASAPATSVPDTTESPVTTRPPETTEPPDTTESTETTEVPVTSEPTGTSEVPPTTTGASPALPSVTTFFAQWNDATAGTDVPTITGSEATELTGQYAGYYLITLTAGGSTAPPQVGLVGKATAPGSGQLEEVMLVWVPGSDEGSSTFYWDSFGVLVQAVSPGATPGEIADLASALGRSPSTPPFTRTADASGGGLDYRAFTLPYSGEAETLEASAIEVS